MAKRYEYPANRSLSARLQCVIESHARMRAVLENMDYWAAEMKMPDTIRKHIAEAVAGAKVAGEAIAGLEDSP